MKKGLTNIAVDALLILDWTKIAVSILFVLSSILIYREVSREGKEAMNSFQLNPEKVVAEYRIILAGNLLMILTSALYLYNGLSSSKVALLAGKGLYAVYILLITAVLYRWVKRF